MEKVIYILVGALVLTVACGIAFSVFQPSPQISDMEEFNPFAHFQELGKKELENTLGLTASEDVSYLLTSPEIPKYPYEREPLLDLVHCIALSSNHSISIKHALSLFKEKTRQLDFPCKLYYRQARIGWMSVENFSGWDGGSYDLLVTMDLVFRSTPISLEEVILFENAVEELAVNLDMVTTHTMTKERVVAKSQRLVNLKEKFDLRVTLVLQADPSRPFQGKLIHDAAFALGLKWMLSSYTWMPSNEHFAPFFMLTPTNEQQFIPKEMVKDSCTFSGLKFWYTLGYSPVPLETYQNMLTAIRYMQSRLGGQIESLDGKIYDEAELAQLQQELATLVKEMEYEGFPPGAFRTANLLRN